ncbi:class I SAM-dependent methyltransferase [Natrinema longum]|uniref:Class I SAM-dependent methyltransferase n=1 Tax=Natrinema longum TaxID=370324 RepID=A0A8A2UAW7_9EURY|nr:class I SAM-dependent methyltransferase [Natrinema longum]MBZ6496343.1 class I SAM-dependent methyltransferase [Natrinema longum]QSW85744.1 class I SAM-dependent methyltransferase [Natrinema longum]
MTDCTPRHATGEGRFSRPLFTALYDRFMPDRFLIGPHREYLAAGLSGRVLDLGAGNGAMFPYAADAGDDLEYHAVEPDPTMRQRAVQKAAQTDLRVHLRDARGESLPYAADSFDVVLSGAVFCTIDDPDAALDEVARVLRSGGELRFLEHVRNDGWRARAQDRLTPLWERAAGGCQLNRETIERFVGHDALDVLEIERTGIGLFPATPILRGRLRRRTE